LTAVAALGVVLGVCGGGVASTQRIEASDLATQLDCAGLKSESTEMYVREGGGIRCRRAGDDYTFNDATAQKSWMDVASTFGGLYLVGDQWVVTGARPAMDAARATVGGAIK
jgi:hypothetical protein